MSSTFKRTFIVKQGLQWLAVFKFNWEYLKENDYCVFNYLNEKEMCIIYIFFPE